MLWVEDSCPNSCFGVYLHDFNYYLMKAEIKVLKEATQKYSLSFSARIKEEMETW